MQLNKIDFTKVEEIRRSQKKTNLTSELSNAIKSESQTTLENHAPDFKSVSFYDVSKSKAYLKFSNEVVSPILKKL